MTTLGPNKKMAWILVLLMILIFLFGFYEFNVKQFDTWQLFSFIPISGKILGIFLMLLLPLAFFNLTYVYKTNKRIYLDSESITLIDGRKIDLLQIDKVVINSVNMLKTGICIYLRDGNRVFITWIQIDCGISKFANLLCDKINEKNNQEKIKA